MNATDDALRSMGAITRFASQWQMDAPLKDFGSTPWFTNNPINLAFDAWGVPAAFVRGMFEYPNPLRTTVFNYYAKARILSICRPWLLGTFILFHRNVVRHTVGTCTKRHRCS